MISRTLAMIVTACLLAAPDSSVAQATSGDVTFRLPLNLTQMSPDIAKIAVFCVIQSDAIPPSRPGARGASTMGELSRQEELAVSGGQLVATATVVVPVSGLDNPVGKTATYVCGITGFSTLLQHWDMFAEAHETAAFRLSPTPQRITGSFTWQAN